MRVVENKLIRWELRNTKKKVWDLSGIFHQLNIYDSHIIYHANEFNKKQTKVRFKLILRLFVYLFIYITTRCADSRLIFYLFLLK